MKHTGKNTRTGGFTLLEVVIAALVLGILSVGSLGYQYHATRDARRAEAHTNAAWLAKMLLDQWKGQGGSTAYDPALLSGAVLTIDTSAVGPAASAVNGTPFELLGHYRAAFDGSIYFVTCSYTEPSETAPRLLSVAVAWRPDYADGALGDDAREVRFSVYSAY